MFKQNTLRGQWNALSTTLATCLCVLRRAPPQPGLQFGSPRGGGLLPLSRKGNALWDNTISRILAKIKMVQHGHVLIVVLCSASACCTRWSHPFLFDSASCLGRFGCLDKSVHTCNVPAAHRKSCI